MVAKNLRKGKRDMKLWKTYLKDTYKILDVLKDKGENKVILAYDKRGRQNCVLKERSLHSRALYETLKAISNPHIPAVYRLIAQEEKLLVIEEYIEGRTLAEIIQSSPSQRIEEALAADILRQLCECLTPLHQKGVIHRDVKPSNLILTKDGVLKLIDFGIARTEKQDTDADTEYLGTRGYAPPEQYGFGQTDARSDIYALGVTMQRALGANYNGCLKNVLSRCTALDPASRYPSAEALLEDMQRKTKPPQKRAVLLAVLALAGLLFYGAANDLPIHGERTAAENKIAAPSDVSAADNAAAAVPVSPAETKEAEPPPVSVSVPDALPAAVLPEPDKADAAAESLQSAALIMTIPQFSYNVPWKEKVRCALFLHDAPAEGFSLPYSEWESWRRENGEIYFPSDWGLRLHIENRSAKPISHPRIRMESFTGEEWIDAPPLPAGQSIDIPVPLNRWPLQDMRTFTLAIFLADELNPGEPQAGVHMGFGLRQ